MPIKQNLVELTDINCRKTNIAQSRPIATVQVQGHASCCVTAVQQEESIQAKDVVE